MKNYFSTLLLAAILCAPFTISAQVTIGSDRAPSPWSVLDLCTREQQRALHNARMDTEQRNALMSDNLDYWTEEEQLEAQGLLIFNTDPPGCLEFWSGSRWVSLCESRIPPPPYLSVTPVFHLFLAGGGTQEFRVSTNVAWSVAWVGTHDGFDYNIPSSNPNNIFTITADDHSGNSRGGRLRVTAGELRQYVNVQQMPGNNSERAGNAVGAFVGAFWRESQQGERLIRIPNTTNNAWTAIAVDDWILLCPTASTDQNLGTATHDCAEDHILDPASPTVSSMITRTGGEIRFRIGLDGTIGQNGTIRPHATDPTKWTSNSTVVGSGAAARYTHRWGRVIVLHNNNQSVHIIWIRQGEGAHYVMTPTCLGAQRNANNVVRWSPFNLTAPGLQHTPSTYVQLANRANPGDSPVWGIKTEFPTQAGAYFKWAENDTHLRRAWTLAGSNATTWGTSPNDATTVWDHFGVHPNNSQETCPPGYRRPGMVTDEIRNVNPAENEVLQSLFANPSNRIQNAVWGVYADGFFDRRSHPTQRLRSYVANGTRYRAHHGLLLFNPETSYHVFFPAARFLFETGGPAPLDTARDWVLFWTRERSDTSATANQMGSSVFHAHPTVRPPSFVTDATAVGSRAAFGWPTNMRMHHGASIRCVVE